MKKNLYCIFIFIGFIFCSCKKDLKTNDSVTLTKIQTSDGANFPFNWETATSMPVSPSSTVQVPMPWQSQSGSPIDAGIIGDYKNSDGWELVYNTFNNTVLPYVNMVPPGGLYFSLYNRYRGLLRFYLYIPPGYINNNVNIQHGLSLYTQNSSSTSMLNFDGSDLVDVNINNTQFTKVNTVGVASQGGWYAMQYEIAYDPGVVNTFYPNIGFTWNSRTVNISTITLNGVSTTTITGNVTQQSSGNGATILNGVLAAVEIVAIAALPESSPIVAAAEGGLAGNTAGFLSGIFGGNSNGQAMDLKFNTTTTLNGTVQSFQPLTPNNLVVSGQLGNTVGAPAPLYNNPLGVFNLTSRPNILVHLTSNNSSENPRTLITTGSITKSYAIDNNSISLITNPSMGANVQILKKELLLLNPTYHCSTLSYPSYITTNGTKETIGNITLVSNPTSVTYQYGPPNCNYLPVFAQGAIRLTLQVTPTTPGYTGGPITITKTFLANFVNQ